MDIRKAKLARVADKRSRQPLGQRPYVRRLQFAIQFDRALHRLAAYRHADPDHPRKDQHDSLPEAIEGAGGVLACALDLPTQAERVAMAAKAQRLLDGLHSPVDCATCGGVCCAPKNLHLTINLSRKEAERLNARHPGTAVQRRDWQGHVVWEIPTPCPFLTGTPGVDARCGIYDHRPNVCAVFPPGCAKCLKLRDRFFQTKEAPDGARRTLQPPAGGHADARGPDVAGAAESASLG